MLNYLAQWAKVKNLVKKKNALNTVKLDKRPNVIPLRQDEVAVVLLLRIAKLTYAQITTFNRDHHLASVFIRWLY